MIENDPKNTDRPLPGPIIPVRQQKVDPVPANVIETVPVLSPRR